jgi:hypothetical protein
MGITNYQPYIKENYSDACLEKWLDSYDNLYIDMNHVLHHVCYFSKSVKDLLDRFRDYLLGIIKIINPKKRIILVADGPAPIAKLLLQRTRRLDSIKLVDKINPKENLNLNLTSGTEFMLKLEKSLEGFINYVKDNYHVEVITCINNSGEGEIKIRQQLQKLQNKYPSEDHIVYSGDSDMILILFTCQNLNKIYQYVNKEMIIFFGKMYDIHIEKFGETAFTKYDFVFINLLMGNDYIPKASYLKLENVWNAYKILSKIYPDGLVTYNCQEIKVDILFLHDLIYFATKNTAKHLMKQFKFSHLKDTSYYDYVQGLYWCFGMYITGECSNYRYIYDHDKSPHITGIMLTIMFNNIYKLSKAESIDIDLYGILLIPEKAKNLLTKEQNLISEKLVKKYPIIYEEERCIECKNYSRTISDLNKEAKGLEKGTDEKNEVKKKIAKINIKLNNHKKSHESLTLKKIEEIEKYFFRCREKVLDTLSIDSDFSIDNNEDCNSDKIEIYKPGSYKNKLF